jgi:hypothetical protein
MIFFNYHRCTKKNLLRLFRPKQGITNEGI